MDVKCGCGSPKQNIIIYMAHGCSWLINGDGVSFGKTSHFEIPPIFSPWKSLIVTPRRLKPVVFSEANTWGSSLPADRSSFAATRLALSHPTATVEGIGVPNFPQISWMSLASGPVCAVGCLLCWNEHGSPLQDTGSTNPFLKVIYFQDLRAKPNDFSFLYICRSWSNFVI